MGVERWVISRLNDLLDYNDVMMLSQLSAGELGKKHFLRFVSLSHKNSDV